MTGEKGVQAEGHDKRLQEVIKLAIHAVGGQGGGVLTGWIETLARSEGWAVQATSVAGVSQRTGATIYYIEMAPGGGQPVFSLMPSPGDVDIMIASEWMEAGRAIMRGFVTPDRTVLVASTHRNLAVSEKMAPGDGIADAHAVRAAAVRMARRLIAADFEAAAVAAGSVISATLFGALAASKALPFHRSAFEEAIRESGGRGIEASLRAFAAGHEMACRSGAPDPAEPAGPASSPPDLAVRGPARLRRRWNALAGRAMELPGEAAAMALVGLRKVVDFQDLAYGAEYLDRLEAVRSIDRPPFELTCEAARHLANAMAYDDVIRVADLKTRPRRGARIRREMGAGDGQVMRVTEYLHPRAEEVVSLLPAGLGAWTKAGPKRMAWLSRHLARGRRIRSDTFAGYLLLYLLGGLRRWRRRTLRHAEEMAHLEGWLGAALAEAGRDHALAVEMLRCRRLIKGYSDTRERGASKYDRVMAGIDLVRGREDAADWARRLREAALRSEEGGEIDEAIETIRSFI